MNLKIKCTKCTVKVKALGVCFFETLVLTCIIKPPNFPEVSSEQQDSKESKEYIAGRAHIENFIKNPLSLNCSLVMYLFLNVFTKLLKAAMSFVMSVRPHGTTRITLDGFSWNLMFEDPSEIYREN
jgi:hypothetical protein